MQDKRQTFGGGGEELANGSWKLRKDNSSQGTAGERWGEGEELTRRCWVDFSSIWMSSPIAGGFFLLLNNIPLLCSPRWVGYLMRQ